MSTTLGKVSFTAGGVYNPSAQYQRLTIVYNPTDGNTYVSRTTVSGVEPGTDAGWQNYWQLLAGHGNGIAGVAKTGTSGNVDTYTITYDNGDTDTFTVTNGTGIPTGGNAGQILAKDSSTDYDVAWVNISSYFTTVLNADGTYTLQIAGGT